MNRRGCNPESCSCHPVSLGGVEASDFATLDELAVKLICVDGRFSKPLREMGRLLGYRIASERKGIPLGLDDALAALIPGCGLEGVVERRLHPSNADEVLLEIDGCVAALGWQVPYVDRTVCCFDAGLFESFLCGATGEDGWCVAETACLGLGKASCEFAIRRGQNGEPEGAPHGQC